MTGRSTVILEEGKITGSFIKVYCHQKKIIIIKGQQVVVGLKNGSHHMCNCISNPDMIIMYYPSSNQKNDSNLMQKEVKNTWIGSRNSSGISPRVASVSIASEAATLALAPSSINSCITLPSSPILLRTSAAALNNWSKRQLSNYFQQTIWFRRDGKPKTSLTESKE